MELSRSQYKQLLAALDNNIEKADSIADIFESWTPTQSIANVAVATLAYAPVSSTQGEVVRMLDGRDPRKLGGVRDEYGNIFDPNA